MNKKSTLLLKYVYKLKNIYVLVKKKSTFGEKRVYLGCVYGLALLGVFG